MFEIVFSPDWFYTFDLAFDVISILVTLLISRYIYKVYKLSERREHKYLYIAFLILALAFAFKIMTNFEIYYKVLQPVQIGNIVVAKTILYESNLLQAAGVFLFRFLMSIAIFGIYLVVGDAGRKKTDVVITSFLIFMLTLFSTYVHYPFHLTLAVFIAFICYELWKKNLERKSSHYSAVFWSFFILLVSQLIFSLSTLESTFYAIGETIQLLGFIALLYNYFMAGSKHENKT